MAGSGSGQIITDPDGVKPNGSYGSGSRTLIFTGEKTLLNPLDAEGPKFLTHMDSGRRKILK